AFVSQLLNGKANMTFRTLAEVAYVLDATVKIGAQDESKSACESVDDSKMQTFHINMPVRKSGLYTWENSGVAQSNPRNSDSRSEVAA
ncbi:MAG: hypothetical protein WCF77_00130, partial [Minisyncoccia bacterium]